MMPAAVISTLTAGWSRSTTERRSSIEAGSSTSSGRPMMPGCVSEMDSRSSRRRPVTMTVLPAAWRRRPRPRPMPEVPPVMRMVFPVMFMAPLQRWRQGATRKWLSADRQSVDTVLDTGQSRRVNRPELADFLRTRRVALQPEDVGLSRGPRRRTPGLRREEVAELAGMSTDYYARLERGNGPQPSEQMAAAIARALRLTLAERDHLFLLTGHSAPKRALRTEHVNPGLMRVLDRLDDTPAQIMTRLGETLVQTDLAVALL